MRFSQMDDYLRWIGGKPGVGVASVQVVVPPHLVGRVLSDRGKPVKTLTRSLQTRSPAEARRRRQPVVTEFDLRIAAAEAAARNDANEGIIRDRLAQKLGVLADLTAKKQAEARRWLAHGGKVNQQIAGEMAALPIGELMGLLSRHQPAEDVSNVKTLDNVKGFEPGGVSQITLTQAIADWKRWHGAWPDTEAGRRAEKKAEQAKRRAAESLLSFAGTRDMAAIDTLVIQAWVDTLNGRVAYDYVTAVKTLYKRLHKATRLHGLPNPAAEIEVPPKPQHQARDQFSAERAALILASSASSGDPLIRWGHPIMAHTGMIITEFVYAPASKIKRVRGQWVWHIGEQRALKTGARPRVMPLHPALLDAGFIDYVQSRGDGLLFDIDADKASAVLLAHLRGLGIPNTRDQVNYSWRHGFISRLVDAGVDPTLRRYLDGHGLAGNIDEKHYIHHQLSKMVAAVRSVEPTVPYADE